jgi:hypothetical protein
MCAAIHHAAIWNYECATNLEVFAHDHPRRRRRCKQTLPDREHYLGVDRGVVGVGIRSLTASRMTESNILSPLLQTHVTPTSHQLLCSGALQTTRSVNCTMTNDCFYPYFNDVFPVICCYSDSNRKTQCNYTNIHYVLRVSFWKALHSHKSPMRQITCDSKRSTVGPSAGFTTIQLQRRLRMWLRLRMRGSTLAGNAC